MVVDSSNVCFARRIRNIDASVIARHIGGSRYEGSRQNVPTVPRRATRRKKRATASRTTAAVGRRAVPSGLRTPARSRGGSRARPRAGARRLPRAPGGPAGKTPRVRSAARPRRARGKPEETVSEAPSEAGSSPSREASRRPQPAVPRARRSRRAASHSRGARRKRRHRPSRASSVCARSRQAHKRRTRESSTTTEERREIGAFSGAFFRVLFPRCFASRRSLPKRARSHTTSHPKPPCLTPSPPSRPPRYVAGAHQKPPDSCAAGALASSRVSNHSFGGSVVPLWIGFVSEISLGRAFSIERASPTDGRNLHDTHTNRARSLRRSTWTSSPSPAATSWICARPNTTTACISTA